MGASSSEHSTAHASQPWLCELRGKPRREDRDARLQEECEVDGVPVCVDQLTGRVPEVSDAIANVLGVATGAALATLATRRAA